MVTIENFHRFRLDIRPSIETNRHLIRYRQHRDLGIVHVETSQNRNRTAGAADHFDALLEETDVDVEEADRDYHNVARNPRACTVRRAIESFWEQKQLRELIADGFDDSQVRDIPIDDALLTDAHD